ncbi:GGDEF domain-containing protein [Vibrio genomosp. F10 str. 9ZC157]|uniref:diguanylate cyclase n=1 Tax=Vibrio genomosp. F10 str. ZF-129 TaxID=1187848 RepID=A0A1E5BHX8_9VIBR|nr:GGDEF domain-containing protein [Vibrio genomosp. F10]OEE36666.1 hypothetical protein A1QO_18930 [Vibrio genomosp. F10 str. ZF-129]OEE95855.1 hypothetical protein A1QM_17650 [Vibrio genomosp. F10 str. 9ZC157]
MNVEKKILDLVVGITEQTNSISLAHCVVATLSEMVPIQSVHLFHYKGEIAQLTAALTRVENSAEQASYEWLSKRDEKVPEDFDHTLSLSVVERDDNGFYRCTFPIRIDENSSARFIVLMDSPPNEYQLLMDGFSQIYKNYLVVLRESEHDPLTGLWNRKMMEQKLNQSFESTVNNQLDDGYASIVSIIDIDNFKDINDTYGHLIGDEVLLVFAQQMQESFSHEENLFRFGGEEFVVLFPRSTLKQAEEKMEKFRQHIESYVFPKVPQVTFSGGICTIKTTDFLTDILDNADKALYYAKDNGRNQVFSYQWLKDEGILIVDDKGDSDVELF